MTGPRVVVIGAGVVGAALADELAARGWDDVTVVDQGPLPAPGGSSSHAPGLVFQTNPSKAMTELARYTVEKLSGLDLDGEPCFLQVGGLEVATTPERLAELHRRHGWATAWGLDARVAHRRRVRRAAPAARPGRSCSAACTCRRTASPRRCAPSTRSCAGPQSRGVRVLERHEVLDVVVDAGGRVTGVVTDQGELPADVVVCCAGIWGPRVAAMVGMDLPLTPLAHQLAWTAPVPAMARPSDRRRDHAADPAPPGRRPLLPRPVRPDRHRLLRPPADAGRRRTRSAGPSDEPPTRCRRCCRSPRTTSSRPGRDSRELLPALGEARGRRGLQRPVLLHHRRLPAARPVARRRGLLGRGGGLGDALGRRRPRDGRVAGRRPLLDVRPARVRRQPLRGAPARAGRTCWRADCQNFVEVYDVKHPLQPMEDPRPLRTSPFHPRQQELGAFFLEANGWERPQWYEANAGLVDGRDVPAPDDWAARYWSPIAAAEAQVTRERVAMYDMTALKRLEVTGPGADGLPAAAVHRQRRQVRRVGDVLPAARRRRRHPQRRHRRAARPATATRSAPTATLDLDRLARRAAGRRVGRRSATSRRAPAASACGARGRATSCSR